jgi:hypothetical protein
MNTYEEFPAPKATHTSLNASGSSGPMRKTPKSVHRIFPDGASDIVLSGCIAVVYGPTSSFRLVREEGLLPGFRIRPDAARTVFGVSPLELSGDPISFSSLWGRHGSEFERRLGEVWTTRISSQTLADFLAERVVYAADPNHSVLAAIDRINRVPETPLKTLVREIGLSERQLRRRFEDHVGLGIKRYARVSSVSAPSRRDAAISTKFGTWNARLGAPSQTELMVEPLRHRQTKGAETDMLDLTPPRHVSTDSGRLPRRNLRPENFWRGERLGGQDFGVSSPPSTLGPSFPGTKLPGDFLTNARVPSNIPPLVEGLRKAGCLKNERTPLRVYPEACTKCLLNDNFQRSCAVVRATHFNYFRDGKPAAFACGLPHLTGRRPQRRNLHCPP